MYAKPYAYVKQGVNSGGLVLVGCWVNDKEGTIIGDRSNCGTFYTGWACPRQPRTGHCAVFRLSGSRSILLKNQPPLWKLTIASTFGGAMVRDLITILNVTSYKFMCIIAEL